MVRPSLLHSGELAQALTRVPEWELRGDRIVRTFLFDDFVAAFAFMTRCAEVANELDHHPEWSNVYNRVVIELTTHDAGGLTELDIRFAEQANDRAAQ